MSAPLTLARGDDSRRAAVAVHIERSIRRVAGQMHAVDGGWLARTPDLPRVWTLNQLHVDVPAAAGRVLALAQRHQAGLGYLHVVVDDDTSGAALAAAVDASWKVEREVLMVLGSPPPGGRVAVEELREDEMLELMRQWYLEEHAEMTADGLDELAEYNRREGRVSHERRLGARRANGAPAAITKLRMDGFTACVEDVYTAAEERRRGLARKLVSHAAWLAHASGHGLTYLLADDDDWPKDLYADIGFRTVGRRWVFHRDAGA
jgi:GNAT superfamily N-acetyltransferase